MYVTVIYAAPGEVPRIAPASYDETPIIVVPAENPVVLAPTGPAARTAAGGTATTFATAATANENAAFAGIISVSKNRIVLPSPNGMEGFDSLATAEYQVLGPYLYTAMTANNPGWQNGMMTDALKTLLFKALGWTQGKGPVACIVFQNGDFGCFQLNMMDRNAPAYLKGTGKDKNGNPIDRAPNMPNGGGISTYVKPVYRSDSSSGYKISGSNLWLICGKVGTTMTCYIESE